MGWLLAMLREATDDGVYATKGYVRDMEAEVTP